MSDLRSVKNTTVGASDQYVEQMRQKIGTDFTDHKSTGKKKGELGKDDFIKLMSAQLKYQDPINPMKNEQMAAQLAQFSALEQMVNVNQNLEKMSAGQKPQENMMAATLIGKRVQTDVARFSMTKGQTPDLKFDMPADAAKATIAVVDGKGEVVREVELGSLKRGPNSIRWDGKNSKSQDASPGEYTFKVMASDEAGKSLTISTGTTGVVTGVVFEQGKSLLMVDGKKIPMEVVSQIEQDSKSNAANDGQKANAGNTQTAGAKVATANGLTADKQNQYDSGSAVDAEKISQLSENLLRGARSLETMNNKGAQVAAEDSESQDALPLWNPASN